MSVIARKGYLRLTTGRIDTNFLMARNSLTQRTIGPLCSGTASLDISKMKDGDLAGLGLLQQNYGLAGVKITGDSKAIVMINADQTINTEIISNGNAPSALKNKCKKNN